MELEDYVNDCLEPGDRVYIVPDLQLTAGTGSILFGREYRWRLNVFTEDRDKVYRERVGERLVEKRLHLDLESILSGDLWTEPRKQDPGQYEKFKQEAIQRAEELRGKLDLREFRAEVDYESFESPEYNTIRSVPGSRVDR